MDYFPKNIKIHLVISADQSIAKPDHLRPRNIRESTPTCLGNMGGGFPTISARRTSDRFS